VQKFLENERKLLGWWLLAVAVLYGLWVAVLFLLFWSEYPDRGPFVGYSDQGEAVYQDFWAWASDWWRWGAAVAVAVMFIVLAYAIGDTLRKGKCSVCGRWTKYHDDRPPKGFLCSGCYYARAQRERRAEAMARAKAEPTKICSNRCGDMEKHLGETGDMLVVLDVCPVCEGIFMSREEREALDQYARKQGYSAGYSSGHSTGSSIGMMQGFVIGSVIN